MAISYTPYVNTASIEVNQNHRFDTTTERDDYFTANPTELVNGVYVTVGTELYKYSTLSASWYNMAEVIKGKDGNDVFIEYSDDNTSFHNGFIEGDRFIRFSNNGVDWESGVQIRADTITFQYSDDGLSWHTDYVSGDVYWRFSTDSGSTWTASSAISDGQLPTPYVFTKNASGQLVIRDNDTMMDLLRLDDSGMEVVTKITTGTGLFEFGDALAIGNGINRVSFIDKPSNKAFFASGGEVSLDGTTLHEPYDVTHGELLTSEPNGTQGTLTTEFNISTTLPNSFCLYKYEFVPAENYTGTLTLLSYNNSTEVVTFNYDVELTSNTPYSLTMQSPLWTNQGDEVIVQLIKEDDDYLLVYGGTTLQNEAYRKLTFRQWDTATSWNASNTVDLVTQLNSEGNIDFDSLTNIPTGSATTLGLVKDGGTSIGIQPDGTLYVKFGNTIRNITSGINVKYDTNNFTEDSTLGLKFADIIHPKYIDLGDTTTQISPYVDFHSSGNNIDYDSRIIATGGNSTIGNGNLQIISNQLTLPDNTILNGNNLLYYGDNIQDSGSISSVTGGTPTNVMFIDVPAGTWELQGSLRLSLSASPSGARYFRGRISSTSGDATIDARTSETEITKNTSVAFPIYHPVVTVTSTTRFYIVCTYEQTQTGIAIQGQLTAIRLK